MEGEPDMYMFDLALLDHTICSTCTHTDKKSRNINISNTVYLYTKNFCGAIIYYYYYYFVVGFFSISSFWQVDSAFASDKAVELDSALGSHAVQYREVQGNETGKFLSYFKPCIIPIEGVFSSEQGQLNNETYKISLLTCKGDHVVHVNEVSIVSQII